MIGSNAWFALMRRNLIYRKRHWIGSILEIVLPLLGLLALLGIKSIVVDFDAIESTLVNASYPDDYSTWTPLSFNDYLTAIQAKRICIPQSYTYASDDGAFNDDATSVLEDTNITISPNETASTFNNQTIVDMGYTISGMDEWNWQVPLIKCSSLYCKEDGQDASSLCEYSVIGIAGDLNRFYTFLSWLETKYPVLNNRSAFPFNYSLVKSFTSSADMDRYVLSSEYGTIPDNPRLAIGIIFNGNDPNVFDYTLRQNSTNYNSIGDARPATRTTPDTAFLLKEFAKDDYESCPPIDGAPFLGPLSGSCSGQYTYNGILTFQRLLHDFIIDQTTSYNVSSSVREGGVQFVPFPTREYRNDGFFAILERFAPILITLGLLYPVAFMASYISQEKQLRQKELLKMMSVTESDIGWSWFVTFFLFHTITIILLSVATDSLYTKSQFLPIFVLWILSFISIINFCMTIGALTSKSIRAVLFAVISFFAGSIISVNFRLDSTSAGTMALISLHPVTAFSYGLAQLGQLEDQGVGVTIDSIGISSGNLSGFSFRTALGRLALDCILWGFLAWYFNRVIKPDYGQAHPFYFPFMPSYWFPQGVNNTVSDEEDAGSVNLKPGSGVLYEPVGEVLRRQADEGKSIEIHNLKKKFGEKVAVDGINLSLYAGQITALLGHNGAGKTTTIAMLTGAIAPTSGYAKVAGKDIRYQVSSIRQDIGICLQHDCLFPMLTVREHIQFFARLKGLYNKVPFQEAEDQIDQSIRDVALFEKRNTYSKSLSGGMKRKLSVAMAFSGGSNVVFLDEPTSGMDPFSRRFTWNVIRQYRQDRCIVLTTHFMDEADILGDRIAIMAEGQLRCAGSSLFLKKSYGVGYQLTIEKTQQQQRALLRQEGLPEPDDFDELDDRLNTLIKSNVSEGTKLSSTGSEVRYQLPISHASKFPPMFRGLDAEAASGSIQSYGVSMTTLDEVFVLVARGDHAKLKLGLRNEKNEGKLHDKETAAKSERSNKSRMDLSQDGMFQRHLGALTRKRVANFSRDKKAWFCTTLCPTLAVLLGLIMVNSFASQWRNLEPIVLRMSDLNKDVTTGTKNPIFYNSPGDPFSCRPGSCSHNPAYIEVPETNEKYQFCGEQALPLDYYASTARMCTSYVSAGIMEFFDSDTTVQAVKSLSDINSASFAIASTSNSFAASQYGAIWFTSDSSSISMSAGVNTSYTSTLIATCQNQSSSLNYSDPARCSISFGGVGYVIQYNFTALHIAPLLQALADEAIVRQATNNANFDIKATIAPFPITSSEETLSQAEDSFLLFLIIVLSFPIISGSFGAFIVTERESKAKHLQTVAGVEPMAYWLSSFIWDLINYQIPMWITIAMFFIFDIETFTTSEKDQFSAIVVTLLFYGSASTAFTYVISFAFKSPSMITTVSIISGFLIGLGGPLAALIMTLLGSSIPKLIEKTDILIWTLRITPPFCLGKSILYILNIGIIEGIKGKELSAWSEPVALYEIYCLAGQTVVYLLLAVLLDKWSTNPSIVLVWKRVISIATFSWMCSGSKDGDIIYLTPDDSDVVNEAQRVLTGGANGDLIVLNQLTKVYDNGKKAVNDVSLGIAPGQCFGLLGINGAGKTTVMGILTAEFPPSSGDAILAGYSVMREPQKTRRRIGYCPQFDAHFANMTGREHVELYASIKGVPVSAVKEAASDKLMEVGLSDVDSDRLCSNYSGGMKRRLSLAIATIGSPQIVFLDECSTGVDPVARREIWEMVSAMVSDENVVPEERTSVILTTHSMEECEALCPRIGIMANGKLRCLGSAQHLKTKFGQGYQLELKTAAALSDDQDYVEICGILLRSKGLPETSSTNDVTFKLSEAKAALRLLSNDDYLSNMVSSEDPIGYNVWRDAVSLIGITLGALAAFATSEIRMRSVEAFVADQFNGHVLRERQDTKARYEISSQSTRISDIFIRVEANKVRLWLDDYGVSQTTLEQVFNTHAAEAEKLKQGRNDH